ncbi:penicillin-binding protein 1C [Ciceribacter sp. L1K23]|uniref:penicillin-binding protein 1C n=1 Tax=Ciceribacter sp. L1K23 TaxID=2820276 RepID=UPI001B8179FE|nr:penicillin-binding protein 1C [Ciceribacter sp. L1K23]
MNTRLFLALGLFTALAAAASTAGVLWVDKRFPPPLEKASIVSTELLDADGGLLRAFATPEGRWRLRTETGDVDPRLIDMLVAYEDRRFWDHQGVDPLALLRAAGQLVGNGRIVSGGSTLTMQLARLLDPGRPRTFTTKLVQIFRALQIESRLSKKQILDLYLTLAPYGGNIEGVRAASLAYFGKEPTRLTLEESALLVALPQLPEARRPDRHPVNAANARTRVLKRLLSLGLVEETEVQRAQLTPVQKARRQLPALAAHLAEAAIKRQPDAWEHRSTIRKSIQEQLEAVARESVARLDDKVALAIVMADARTGDVIAEVGSADYFDPTRSGWIDMTTVKRSPGSTLKPFIYALAFEEGVVAQETLVEDRPADFFGYRPRNFDMAYQGDVSVRQALQLSLNVPAVKLLDTVGPLKLAARLRRAGVDLKLPRDEAPGLAIALGGAGVTLRELVQLYTAFGNRGRPVRLTDGIREPGPDVDDAAMMEASAAWNVVDVLTGVTPPPQRRSMGIAYKTGTSYGYRDAWSVGFDGRYVIGVWVGRPDNGAVPGMTGYGTAAPILFDAFERSGLVGTPFPPAPGGVMRRALADLPASLRRFSTDSDGLLQLSGRQKAPQIVYPPDGAQVELGRAVDGTPLPLALKLQDGRPPFRWLADGKPMAEQSRSRVSQWSPEGGGYSKLTVIDAQGRAASVGVFIKLF